MSIEVSNSSLPHNQQADAWVDSSWDLRFDPNDEESLRLREVGWAEPYDINPEPEIFRCERAAGFLSRSFRRLTGSKKRRGYRTVKPDMDYFTPERMEAYENSISETVISDSFSSSSQTYKAANNIIEAKIVSPSEPIRPEVKISNRRHSGLAMLGICAVGLAGVYLFSKKAT